MKKVTLLDWVMVIAGVAMSTMDGWPSLAHACGSMLVFGTFLNIMSKE